MTLPHSRAWRWLTFIVASAAFFAVTGFYANRKLLWFDELFTVFIARQTDPVRFVAALTNAGDTLPPGIHVLTRWSIALFGERHISIRLPAMAGYWLMLVSVYGFVRYRCGRFAAWSAVLVVLASGTYWYAYEARPYALLAGASAAALVSWQRTAGPHRVGWLVGLVLSVVAAFLVHWYAVLLIPLILLGEAVRTFESGERRAGVPAALVVAIAIVVPILYPFFLHGWRFRGLIGPPDPATFLFHAYDLVLGGFSPFLLLLLVAAGAAPLVNRQKGVVRSELAIAGACALLPVIAYVFAWALGSQLLPRYAIVGVLGCAILVGYVAEHVTERPTLAVAWVAILSFAVVTNLVISKLRMPDRSSISRRSGDFQLLAAIQNTGADEIVVVPDGLAFIRLAYYAPPVVARRLVHVVDPASLGSRALEELSAYASLDVERRDRFLQQHRTFNVYNVGFESSALASLASDGLRLSAVTTTESVRPFGQLYKVRIDRTGEPSTAIPR